MPAWLEVILEILKLTIPGLIVFLTVYYLFKQYFEKQYQISLLELRKNNQKTSIPLRLQAYERLSMLCERIAIPSLVYRLQTEDANAATLRVAMMMAIQQEFEHNVTQQVYVSEQLWEIIKLARDETLKVINGVAEKVDPKAPAKELAGILFNYLDQQEIQPLETAQAAIRKEAGLLL
jgi:hypothetical protein